MFIGLSRALMTFIFKYPEGFSYEIIKAKRNYLEKP